MYSRDRLHHSHKILRVNLLVGQVERSGNQAQGRRQKKRRANSFARGQTCEKHPKRNRKAPASDSVIHSYGNDEAITSEYILASSENVWMPHSNFRARFHRPDRGLLGSSGFLCTVHSRCSNNR